MDIDYKAAADKLWEKIDQSDPQGCWPWLGKLDRYGYGRFSATIGPNVILRMRPHRLAYVLTYGELDPELDLDHMCHNVADCDLAEHCPHRACCQPLHLFAETKADHNKLTKNNQGVLNANKTHCKRGHEFTPENTMTNNRGQRNCRTCLQANRAAAHARRRAAKGLPVYAHPGAPSPKNIVSPP